MNSLKRPNSLLLALLLTLFPLSSRADVGNLGALAIPALSVAATVWALLTVFAFFLLRRRLTLAKRISASILLFFSPVLWLALIGLKGYAFGEFYSEVTETTHEPVSAASATFPPGSRAHYEQTGGFFGWHARRELLDIQNPQPVKLGDLRIDGLKLDRYSAQLHLSLSQNQMLDGWLCAAGEYTIVDATSNGYELNSCWLAAPREWHGKSVPSGTYVSRDGYGGWLFASMYRPGTPLPSPQ
ncbi:hypothetical protein [Caballeronia sp. S22]|uniref:hypothetical protein n=1 Tax=Caballeronia sp. S22 TaxID=3137182 RepID=UPI0035307B04